MAKKKKYWGGFCNNRLCTAVDFYNLEEVLAIYLRKKDAKKYYQDVRPVEIKEIKK